MKIINLDNNKTTEPVSLAMGNFDGIHLAHKELLESNIKIAKKINSRSAILLFNNHTKTTISNKSPGSLISDSQKLDILNSLGLEVIFKMEFTKYIMALTPEKYIEELLLRKLNIKNITVGFDYKFGYKASGNINSLRNILNNKNINLNIIEPIKYKNKVISSTKIRELIKKGELENIPNYLGRNYSIKGKVVHGKKRGRTLGFPTANIKLETNYVLPPNGVYISRTKIGNKLYKSITNIGENPTFKEGKFKIENYILKFNDKIYNETIEVELISFLREEIKFNNKNELINQMNKDIESILN